MELSHRINMPSIETNIHLNHSRNTDESTTANIDYEFSDGDRNNNAECNSNSKNFKKFITNQRTSDNLSEITNCDANKNSSAMINFSVDSILSSSSNKSRISGNDSDSAGLNYAENDFSKIYRPMPVRYMPNAVPMPGEYGFLFI